MVARPGGRPGRRARDRRGARTVLVGCAAGRAKVARGWSARSARRRGRRRRRPRRRAVLVRRARRRGAHAGRGEGASGRGARAPAGNGRRTRHRTNAQQPGCRRPSMGQLDQAEALLGESLERKRTLGDGRGMAATLSNLGLVAADRDDLALAHARFEGGAGAGPCLGRARRRDLLAPQPRWREDLDGRRRPGRRHRARSVDRPRGPRRRGRDRRGRRTPRPGVAGARRPRDAARLLFAARQVRTRARRPAPGDRRPARQRGSRARCVPRFLPRRCNHWRPRRQPSTKRPRLRLRCRPSRWRARRRERPGPVHHSATAEPAGARRAPPRPAATRRAPSRSPRPGRRRTSRTS